MGMVKAMQLPVCATCKNCIQTAAGVQFGPRSLQFIVTNMETDGLWEAHISREHMVSNLKHARCTSHICVQYT